jgi:hypothetical protein
MEEIGCCRREPRPEQIYYPAALYEQWKGNAPFKCLGEWITTPGGAQAKVLSAPYCRLYWVGEVSGQPNPETTNPSPCYQQWETESNHDFPSLWAFFPENCPNNLTVIASLEIKAKRLRDRRYRFGGAVFNTPVSRCRIFHFYPGCGVEEEIVRDLFEKALVVQDVGIGKAAYLERRGTFLKKGANFLSYEVSHGRMQSSQMTPRCGMKSVPAQLPAEDMGLVLQRKGRKLVPIANISPKLAPAKPAPAKPAQQVIKQVA